MELLQWLQNIRSPFMDKLFLMTTALGEETFLIVIVCTLLWCIDKRKGYILGMSYFFAGIFVQALKVTFAIERPWLLNRKVIPVEGAIEEATGYSFPSGHTQSAVSLWGSIGIMLKKTWAYILAISIILLIGISRMYLGVHTPSDVFVSMLVSTACLFAVNFMVKKFDKEEPLMEFITPMITVLSIILMFYARFKNYPNGYDALKIVDNFKTAGISIGFFWGCLLERKYLFYSESAPLMMQILKLLMGIIVLLILKSTLKVLLDQLGLSLLPASFIRYMILGLWVSYVYPVIIMKLKSPNQVNFESSTK